MNTLMITKLINKDWQLYKWFVLGYIALGVIASILMTIPSYTVFYVGLISVITILIGASAHIVLTATVTEIKESQYSFLMGLPITPKDYAISKLVGGLGIYFLCWLAILAFLVCVMFFSAIPNGMVPLTIILALEILVATSILLAVGIIAESVPVSIITMVILNVFFNLFMFSVAGLEGVGPFIEQSEAVFNSTVFTIIGAEIGTIVLIMAITLFIKSRQVCFL